jgi:hypothetical protein
MNLLLQRKFWNHQMKFKIAILGGCFPVQEQINPAKLYHRLIKDRILKEYHAEIEFSIFRYDTFRQCPGILNHIDTNNISCILLHIRPDPYLQASKFYLKYIDNKNRKRKRINFHLTGFREPDINPVNFGISPGNKSSTGFLYLIRKQIRGILRNVNYLTGYVIGNNLIVKKETLKTISEINKFCIINKTKIIVQGPPMRPRSFVENTLLKNLENYLTRHLRKDLIYIHGFYNRDNSGNYIFLEDKIHLNESGHSLYAELLYKDIVNIYLSNNNKIVKTEEIPVQFH